MSEHRGWKPTIADILVALGVVVLLMVGYLVLLDVTTPDLPKATYCKTTLNALNKSALVYAEMNGGYLMPYTHIAVPGMELTEAAPMPDHTAVCFADGPTDPCSRLLMDSRHYGIVYASGIMRPAEMFYCPEQAKAPYRLQDYPKPWGSAVPQGAKFIFCGYMFNPWVRKASDEGEQVIYDDGLVLARHPNQRFLTADLITGPETIAHRYGESFLVNVAFIDGHVEGVEGDPLAEMFERRLRTDWNSWEHWGAVSADGQEPGPETIRYQLLKATEPSL